MKDEAIVHFASGQLPISSSQLYFVLLNCEIKFHQRVTGCLGELIL